MFLLSIGLLLAVIIAIFAVQNALVVSVQFFFWRCEASLAVVILGSTLCGALILGLVALVKQIGHKLKVRELNSRIERLEQELKKQAEELERVTAEQSAKTEDTDTAQADIK